MLRKPQTLREFVGRKQQDFCHVIESPEMWSETMAQRTLSRLGSTAYNIQDVQRIIHEYLNVLCDTFHEER